jgi:hypothetical protein
LGRIGVRTLFIERGSPWETDKVEKPVSAMRCYFPPAHGTVKLSGGLAG